MHAIKYIVSFSSRFASHKCMLLFFSVTFLAFLVWPKESIAQVPRFPGCDVQTQIPEDECNALRIFFEKTDGENWADRGGWMIAGQACEWKGVVCETGPWPRNVRKIVLIDNDVGGTIPGELSFLSELEELIIQTTATAGYFNVVGGFLPSGIGDLLNLKVLRISGHEIQGPIPTEWGNLQELEVLDLSNNSLDGRIPDGIGTINTLQEIDLSSNRFVGFIPQNFGNLSNLQKLDLGSNNFIGSMPQELGQLTELQVLDLKENQLTGQIPASIGSLPNLISLILTDNDLSGPPPPSVIHLASSISICSLAQQNQTFCIPDSPLYRANGTDAICGVPLQTSCTFCSSLQSSGNGSCSALESLFYNTGGIDWINFTGWLDDSDPCEWFGIDCSENHLQTLALPNNNLTGNIPEELGELTNLLTLDLSGNLLTGPLPLSVALLQTTTNACNLTGNESNLCIPDDPGIAAITSESICGLPITFSCSLTGRPGIFSSIESTSANNVTELTWRATRGTDDVYFEVEQKGSGAFSVIGRVDTPKSTENPQLFAYPLPQLPKGIHTFRINMISPNGTSLYSDELDIVTSVNNVLLEPPFPNPASTIASVQFVTQEPQSIQIALYDITGRKISTIYDGNPEVDLVHEVDIQTDNLAGGVYFLRMEGNASSTTQTLVIQK